jgi:D-alanine-D-alanine ligase
MKIMRQNLQTKYKNQMIGLVYDLPIKLNNSDKMIFPEDASAEWESQNTIEAIIETWKQLGFSVILFPLDSSFLKKWNEMSCQCSLIHSLVEGWGSLARESWIPSLCELSGIPFIGSEPFAQSLCMSKTQIKLICQFLKIPTLKFYKIKNINELANIPREFFNETHFIKPDGEGSGMGIDASFSISNSKSYTEKITSTLLEQ